MFLIKGSYRDAELLEQSFLHVSTGLSGATACSEELQAFL